ncbi:MAG: extracellular solute-binding protein [Candidatus Falkowbacteria bacterium]
MNKKLVLLTATILLMLVAVFIVLFIKTKPEISSLPKNNNPVVSPVTNGDKIKLVYAAHWTEKYQLEGVYENGVLKEKGFKQYLDEYMTLHPNVDISVLTVPYADYEAKIKLLNDIDQAPDIFQIYSPWGVSYAKEGLLDVPPKDIKADVEANYVSKSGVVIDGNVWGIPGEVNDYSLIYNKKMFKDAGIVDADGNALAPKTWDDVVAAAKKITKKDTKGNIIKYGFAFTKGVDWAVVDPFLSLLFSNGGSYLSADNSKPMFNDAKGVEVLTSIVDLFKKGYTDANSNVWDFSNDKAAMAFVAPWTEGTFRDQMGTRFDQEVGVTSVPYFSKPNSLQYSWFVGVMNKSKNKKAAWDFLRWFTEDVQPSGTTRYGDLLARTIKAIPDRKVDLVSSANKDVLVSNTFKAPFIAQLSSSTPEPNVLQAAKIKATLMEQIQAAWVGKDVKQALDDAASRVQLILDSNNKK